MLYVQTADREVSWHVGNSATGLVAGMVTEIQADGDELEKILRMCEGIPNSHKSVQTWYGDHARFIAKAIGVTK